MAMDYLQAENSLIESTAVVIPSYFPENAEFDLAFSLLEATVAGCCRQLGDPQRVCVSVDGSNPAYRASTVMQERYGIQRTSLPRNKGKLAAIQLGIRQLLASQSIRYLAVLDQDADHFPNEIPNLVKLASHMESVIPTDRVLVIGGRISRHHPMGLFRGELEELADRMLLDGLEYNAAARGVPLRLEFAVLDEFPDFHSGYKLFSRALAEVISSCEFESSPDYEESVHRHAVEAILTVESLLAGGILGTVVRSTTNEQPVSAFDLMHRARLTADMIIWPCRRLGVPAAFVGQWLDNHLARLRLMTLADGRQEALAVRQLVRRAFDLGTGAEPLAPPFL